MQLASLIRNDTGSNTAPTVILLHGAFGRARNLGSIQRALSPFFNTVAFDLRSHGDSPHAPLSYPAMAEDVLESMDALGIESAYMIGHSMGGKTAMATTLTAPERIKKLVVADIAPDSMIHGQNELAQRLYFAPLPTLKNHSEIRKFLLPLTDHNAAIAELMAQHIAPGAPAHWTIGLSDIVASFPTIQEWPTDFEGKTWDGEALFIRGEASPYILPQHYDVIRRYFPKAEIKTIPNTNHWLHIEDPTTFNNMVLNFLRD